MRSRTRRSGRAASAASAESRAADAAAAGGARGVRFDALPVAAASLSGRSLGRFVETRDVRKKPVLGVLVGVKHPGPAADTVELVVQSDDSPELRAALREQGAHWRLRRRGDCSAEAHSGSGPDAQPSEHGEHSEPGSVLVVWSWRAVRDRARVRLGTPAAPGSARAANRSDTMSDEETDETEDSE